MRIMHSAQTAPSRAGDEITAVNSAKETGRLRRLCKNLMEEAPAERLEFKRLLELLGRSGPARIGAINGLSSFSATYGIDELWEAANSLVQLIKSKKEDAGERFAALDAIVAVMNSINSLRGGEKGETVDSMGEGLLQGMLPKPGIGCSSGAMDEEVKAHKEKFGRMEGVREDSLIGLLNSVSLAEIFDNRELSAKIKEAIGKMDSPYAKKIAGAWRNSQPPAEGTGEKEGVLGDSAQEKKIGLGELFADEEEEVYETG